MDVARMLAHCLATDGRASGRLNHPPRILIGRLIGPAFKSILINEKPFGKNGPTDKKLMISDQRDFAREQEGPQQRVGRFHQAGDAGCRRHPHPFFGRLSAQDCMDKHLDHHRRQSGT